MTELVQSNEPLLSICIPTYNRETSLRNLCRNLLAIKQRFGSLVDICVSNNGSTDGTAGVLEEYRQQLNLRIVKQASNIGGTLNILAVAQMSEGRWGIFVGDDDELSLDDLGELLGYLRGIDSNTWVLVDAADVGGHAQYMAKFSERSFTAGEFKRAMIRSGLNPFRFMGTHVFPKRAIATFGELHLDEARPWPFLAALLREISRHKTKLHVVRRSITLQARGGAKLFWSGGDLARLRLAKLQILGFAKRSERWSLFYWALLFRELYSISSYRTLLSWKLYEGEDFQKSAVAACFRSYKWFGILAPLTILHALPMLFLRVCPNAVYQGLFRLVGRSALLERYQELKREMGQFDGIKRGI